MADCALSRDPGNAWSEENSDCAGLNVGAIGYLLSSGRLDPKGHRAVTRTRREDSSSGAETHARCDRRTLRGGLVADYRPHAPLRRGHDAIKKNGARRAHAAFPEDHEELGITRLQLTLCSLFVLMREKGSQIGWKQQPPSSMRTSMPSMHRSSNCSIRPCAASPSLSAVASCLPLHTKPRPSASAAACRDGGRASFVRN